MSYNKDGYKEGDWIYRISGNKIIKFFVALVWVDYVYESRNYTMKIPNEDCRRTLSEARELLKQRLSVKIPDEESKLLEMKMIHDKLEDEVSDWELIQLGVVRE